MKKISKFVLSVLLIFLMTTSVYAGPINVDAGWYGFCFGGDGSAATAGCQNSGIGVSGNSTTFTTLVPVLFKITDAFDKGDQFEVYINSVLTFTTPDVPVVGAAVSNPDLAFADLSYSHGSWLLNAGSYSINVFAYDSPWGGGGAYLEVETASVPEPTTILLLGLGLMGLAGVKRKMKK
jgi:hypothetical protein